MIPIATVQTMHSAKAVYFWACFGLSVFVARAAPPPVPQCDGVNCFVVLPHTSGANEMPAEHSVPPAPAKLLKLQVDSNIAPASADCKPPVKLNASSCSDQGLPCASMGRSFFFSPANQYNLAAGPASCSGSFITDDTVLTAGHCCMPLAGAWVSDVFFYTDYNDGQFSGAYAPIEMTVSEHWNNFTDRRYDWCFMKMNATVAQHLKTSWLFEPSQIQAGFSAYGWPADDPYDGSSLYQASGQCRGTSPVFPSHSIATCNQTLSSQAAAVVYMTCNTLNDGGGPWYDPTLGIFGLNSASVQEPGKPEVFVSPYFGGDFYESCKHAGVCV
jgi:hypothetical protein